MANVYAIASGSWSNPAIWNTGALPTSSDDVYSNGFSVTIDQNVTVISIRNQSATGIVAGGNFTLQSNKTVNANIYAGTVQCLVYSAGGTSTINGNINGGSGSSSYGVNTSSSTLNINGNLNGGTGATAPAVITGANAVVNVTGNLTGGSGNAFSSGLYVNANNAVINITGDISGSAVSHGLYLAFLCTVTVNGNTTGGSGAGVYGVSVNAAGCNVTINGNSTGGAGGGSYGTHNNAISTVIINGTATGGSGGQGAVNASTGTIRVTVAKGNDTNLFAGLHGSNSGGVTTWEKLDAGPNGVVAATGYTKMKDVSNNSVVIKLEGAGYTTLVDTDDISSGLPAISDVRSGVVYDFGNKTGTCAVPLPGQVLTGVAVDNTVGTALLTAASVKAAVLDADVSTLTVANSIGERLKNCATVESTGAQITALNP